MRRGGVPEKRTVTRSKNDDTATLSNFGPPVSVLNASRGMSRSGAGNGGNPG